MLICDPYTLWDRPVTTVDWTSDVYLVYRSRSGCTTYIILSLQRSLCKRSLLARRRSDNNIYTSLYVTANGWRSYNNIIIVNRAVAVAWALIFSFIFFRSSVYARLFICRAQIDYDDDYLLLQYRCGIYSLQILFLIHGVFRRYYFGKRPSFYLVKKKKLWDG